MRTTPLRLFVVLFLLATILPAAVVIQRYDGPLPVRPEPDPQTLLDLPLAISNHGPMDKVETPSSFFILPAFKIDSSNSMGETTAIAVRNEDVATNTVTLLLFAANSALDPIELTKTLVPKEVWTINLRSETQDIPADFGGTIRGWAKILGDGSQLISVDYFQINPGQDFATGGRLINVEALEFCNDASLRFLVGGAFTGGTLISFMLDQPLGSNPMSDPPSITGTVYREDGGVDGTFEVFTDDFSLEVDANNLIGNDNFGSMDITFENDFNGGFAVASYKADNRYSVSVKNVCRNAPSF